MVYMSLHPDAFGDINAFLLHGGRYVVSKSWGEVPSFRLCAMGTVFLSSGLLPRTVVLFSRLLPLTLVVEAIAFSFSSNFGGCCIGETVEF
eukprot:1005831-Ditylum_brightwellii.AAC.1